MVALLLSRTFAYSLNIGNHRIRLERRRDKNKEFDFDLNRVLGNFALVSSYLTLLPIQGINFLPIATTEITLNSTLR